MEQSKRTVRRRREIIEAAIGAAQAMCCGDRDGHAAHLAEAGKHFARQATQSAARHLFNQTYRNEWKSLQQERAA